MAPLQSISTTSTTWPGNSSLAMLSPIYRSPSLQIASWSSSWVMKRLCGTAMTPEHYRKSILAKSSWRPRFTSWSLWSRTFLTARSKREYKNSHFRSNFLCSWLLPSSSSGIMAVSLRLSTS
jgi:hypothetical protein